MPLTRRECNGRRPACRLCGSLREERHTCAPGSASELQQRCSAPWGRSGLLRALAWLPRQLQMAVSDQAQIVRARFGPRERRAREGMPEIGFATYTSPGLHLTLTQRNSEQVTDGVSETYPTVRLVPRRRRLISGAEAGDYCT